MLPWVLLPGTLCTQGCFMPMLAALAAKGIEPATSTFLLGDSANPVEEATRLLGNAPERFVVCAFSLGGIVALQAALAASDRIVAMILISVTGRADPEENAVTRRGQVEQARLTSPAALVRDTLWPNYVAADSLHDDELRSRIEAMATDTKPQRIANQAEIAIARQDVIDSLASVRIPTLVINGEVDVATPPERGNEVARALAKGRHTLIGDAGHFVLMEKANATADEIASFVRSQASVFRRPS